MLRRVKESVWSGGGSDPKALIADAARRQISAAFGLMVGPPPLALPPFVAFIVWAKAA
jgi:hypothetical protein